MGSQSKRRAVEELITTGELPPEEEGLESTEGDRVADGPLDTKWLDEIRESKRKVAADNPDELRRFREFYKQPDLTKEEILELLELMERAAATPEEFIDDLRRQAAEEEAAADDSVAEEGVMDKLRVAGGCAKRIPRWFIWKKKMNAQEVAAVKQLRLDYKLGDTIRIDPHDHKFETCDPGWWRLLKEHEWDMPRWPAGLADYLTHSPDESFIHDDKKGATKVALMSDFGTGRYHSLHIARQLEAARYPYVFHLGDVYYGGRQNEFEAYYTNVLSKLMDSGSSLFSLPENHELYTGGRAYQKFLVDNQARILQRGSYFCVRFAEHQIVGVDVNWNGRQKFQHDSSRTWLSHVLATGGDRTTIMLTGSAPYCYGEENTTRVWTDLKDWHQNGDFAMWFWGDDHYCALFKRDKDKANFVGSCIGHGGFPGGTMPSTPKAKYVDTHWIEDQPRFPEKYKLRQDMGNNGWCELTLLAGGGVELRYVDWLGCTRCTAKFERDPNTPSQLKKAHVTAAKERKL